ncbi:MAG TPA: PH domain-containing protein [Verrucomicrobiae bacterium]|jgi:membrane protein YdbS with pleckstrin-like domain
MALVQCPECSREVSSVAKACPACGYPIAEKLVQPSATEPDELLAEVRPSWWRYFWLLLFAWLLVPWLIAWFRRSSVVLRVYRGRVMLERGIFSKCYRELFVRDIRSIDIDQSFLSRLINIGDVTISTAASADATENVEGVPDPKGLRDLIISQRKQQ